MPFLAALGPILGSIGAIGGLASTGIGLAESIGGQPSQPSSPPAPTAAQNVAAEVAKRQQEAQVVNRQIPGLVDQTSGGLSDQAYQTEGSTAAGAPGTFGQGGLNLDSIMQFLGMGANSGPSTNMMSLASTGPSITG